MMFLELMSRKRSSVDESLSISRTRDMCEITNSRRQLRHERRLFVGEVLDRRINAKHPSVPKEIAFNQVWVIRNEQVLYYNGWLRI